jgi:hypothetical protein
MEGSYSVEGEQGYWLNLRSRGRALLMLFLFSDVGPDDAPTRIKVGSHLDVPPFLVAAGDRGMSFFAACAAMDAAGARAQVHGQAAPESGRAAGTATRGRRLLPSGTGGAPRPRLSRLK